MNFALLGADAVCMDAVRAISRSSDDRLVLATNVGEHETEIRSLFPQVRLVSSWEPLLDRHDLQAAILSAQWTAQWERCRPLIQSGLHLILSPSDDLSLLGYYELIAISEQTEATFLPLLTERLHPAMERLRQLLVPHVLGSLQTLYLERRWLPCPAPREPPSPASGLRLTPHPHALEPTTEVPTVIYQQLAADVDWLAHLADPIRQVVAVGGLSSSIATNAGLSGRESSRASPDQPQQTAATPPNALSVQMTSAAGVLITWVGLWPADFGPANDRAQEARSTSHLRVVASDGTATLEGDRWEEMVRLCWTTSDGRCEEQRFGPWCRAEAVLSALKAGIDHKPSGLVWADAVRSAEVVDAARRSFARRRVVQLETQRPTEEAAFKSTMTALGCGLLSLAPVLVVLSALGSALGIPVLSHFWYGVPVLLVAFLLLQLLRLVLRDQES